MKKIILSFLVLIVLSLNAFCQDFLGLSTGNYTGVTGVLLQPASIVDSRYKFDVNLFTTGVNYSNNYFLLNRDAILKFNKNNFNDYQTFKSKYLTEAAIPANESVYFNISNRTQLPLSFMATLSKKSAIAFSIQSRSMIQGRNFSQDLANVAYNGFYYPPLNNRPIDVSNFSINSLSWVEAGLTYGRVIYSKGKHFLKAAFTAKYLGGIASLNMGSSNFRISVNNDSSINFNTTNFQYNHNKGADFDMVFNKNYRPDASSFGFDAGLVYEYRGNLSHFKYIKTEDGKSYEADRRDVNKYTFKLGVSLLDAGMFTFDKPQNVNSFSANVTNWNLHNSHYTTIKQFDTALASRVVANPNDPRQYNVYLPTALSVQLDIHFIWGLYVNAMAYRPVTMGSSSGSHFNDYGYYTITPRWERRHFGIYIPYTFIDKNNITNYNQNMLGATIRLGPVFLGSSNLGTMAFNKNLRAADVHIGFKVGITYGKPTKASRFFEKKHGATTTTADNNAENNLNTGMYVPPANTNTPYQKNNVVVDYTKGHIYADGTKNGNIIIINNNYYYGNNPPVPGDTATAYQQNYQVINPTQDSINRLQDSLRFMKSADSSKRILKDSISTKRAQLDSVINRLQMLRFQMDSTKRSDSAAYLNQLNRGYNGNNAVVLNNNARANNPMPGDTAKLFLRNGQRDTAAFSRVYNDTSGRNNQYVSTLQNDKKKSINAKDTLVITTAAQNNTVPSTAIINSQLTPQQLQQRTRQNELLNSNLQEANTLQQQINDLQRRLNTTAYTYRAPVGVNTVPVVVAPTVRPNYNPTYTPGYTSVTPRYKRDTVYIRDTIRIRDTVGMARRDNNLKRSDVTPNSLHVPAAQAGIIKNDIDYNAMPAEVVLFDLGKTTIRPTYYNKLNHVAEILKDKPGLTAAISGHTDKTGSPKINKILSLKRANAVQLYLVNKGVDESKLKVSALSDSAPAKKGTRHVANPQDRRVVVKISAD